MANTHTTYQARLYLNSAAHDRMGEVCRMLNRLYNAALEHRRGAYKSTGENVTLYDQSVELTQIRADMPEWEELAIEASRGVLRRLDRAYNAFFRRVTHGETAGFPRFKPISRFRTIELAGVRDGMVKTNQDGSRGWLQIKGLPRLRFKCKLPLPDGKLRGILITKRATGWYVSLQYEVEKEPLPEVRGSVGIDMGVKKRLALSNGETIPPREIDRTRENELRRKVAFKKRGSSNRRKAVASLSRETFRNSVRNRNECHRITTDLARRFGLIAMEDLKVKNMSRSARGTVEAPGKNVKAKSGLNRSILEQTWGLIRSQLAYKAEWAGRQLELVNPRNTSTTCSRCGVIDAESRQGEVYRCRHCGLEIDADLNASINILRKANGAREYRAALL